MLNIYKIKKNKSFTLLEIMIIIMIVSIFSLGLMKGMTFFQNEAITQNNIKKLKIIEKDFQKIFTFRSTSFLFRDSVTYTQDGTTYTKFYENDKIVPIYREDSTIGLTPIAFSNFWKTSLSNLTDFANTPLDIIIENKYFDYYTIVPYKNIYIISWGRLNSYPSWNNTLKEKFFKQVEVNPGTIPDPNKPKKWVFNSYANLGTTDKTTVDNWLKDKGLDVGFLNREINYVKINNMQIMKDKIKVTIDRINKIENNLKYWVTAQIKSVSGTGSMPGKDFFIFKKYDGTAPNIVDGSVTYKPNFIDTVVDNTASYKDSSLANVFSFIDTSKTDGAIDRYITTSQFELSCTEDTMGLTTANGTEFTFKGMAPLDESYSKCTPSSVTAGESTYQILPSTKRIMGLISNIDGREEISGFPLFVSNTGVGAPVTQFTFTTTPNPIDSLPAGPQAIGMKSTAPVVTTVPVVTYQVPPYNVIVTAVFPWVIDGNFISNAGALSLDTELNKTTNVYFNSFGFYNRTIYSISSGI